MRQKAYDPEINLRPMTLEGCVVRMADTISYVGRDIEDAIRMNIITRSDIPEDCKQVLGTARSKRFKVQDWRFGKRKYNR